MDPITVFAVDPYIWSFMEGNITTVAVALMLLKGIAKMTPNVHDDKIATLLGRMFSIFQKDKPLT